MEVIQDSFTGVYGNFLWRQTAVQENSIGKFHCKLSVGFALAPYFLRRDFPLPREQYFFVHIQNQDQIWFGKEYSCKPGKSHWAAITITAWIRQQVIIIPVK